FQVTQLKIFNACPGAGGQVIHDFLVSGPISLPNNGGFVLSFDLESAPVKIPTNFWLGLAFSTNTAGWIGGAAPTIGASTNIIHVPTLPCNAVFANPSLYGAMYADIFCATAQTFFVGYQSETPTGVFHGGAGCTSGGLGGCGDGINLSLNCETAADDIMPIVPNCQLHGYSVNVAGIGGPFQMEFELWSNDPSVPVTGAPLAPIPNTRGCYNGTGNGFLEQAAFTFDGSVTLPPKFWLVWADDDNNAGPIEAGAPAEIGQSGDYFAIYDLSIPAWEAGFFFNGCTDGDGDACGSFHITVQCLGEGPTGACCDQLSGICTDGVLVGECDGRWEPSVTCSQAAFDPPCGATACCKVDPQNPADTICENEIPSTCVAEGGEPSADLLCDAVDCGIPGCIGAVGDCLVAHGTPGCAYNSCCNIVCGIDPFCCNNQWDETCVATAQQVCPPQPPINDSCNDALPISLGTHSFSTIGAMTDGPSLPQSCISGGSLILGSDIWYQFIAPASDVLSINLCTATNYDSRIAVYEGCVCPPAQLIACDDDGCDPDPGADPVIFSSRLMLPVTSGHCYLLRVGGWGTGEAGSGQIALSIGPVCGDGIVAVGEQCDSGAQNGTPGSCCTGTCTFVSGGTVCRASSGVCGAAEFCTGQSAACPPNGFQPSSTLCRPSAGPCDVAENCTGNSAACPPDAFAPSSQVCNPSAGPCDVAENCTGSSAACAPNGFAPSSQVCRASAGVCDMAEDCTGSSASCPADGFTAGNECRPVQGICDVAEVCDGSGADCPADGFASGNVCHESTSPCDPAEACDGSGTACPADVLITACINGDGCCPTGCTNANDNDCPPILIPTVSEWGLIILALLFITMARVRSLDVKTV
ncbi:MAG: IPTL-CTERM sorting domain-containing protein, partial [Planctomycetota bacterium]